jgi:hypothetical protein
MRILLDECVPRTLRRGLVGIDVRTVTEMGWSGKQNGELISLMNSAGFEVLVTVDRGFEHEQHVPASSIALIVLHAQTNRLDDLLPLIPLLRQSLASIRPGDVQRITA